MKVSKDLWARIKQCAEAAGYSSPEEFVQHVIEKEVARLEQERSDEQEVARHLKGLGYID